MIESSIIDNDDGTTTITLAWPEIPVGFRMNNMNMHYRDRTKKVIYWRDETFCKLGEGAPALQWFRVRVLEVVPYPPEHRWFPDVAASLPAVKAAIDGLVEHCKLVPNDAPEHVRSLMFEAPVYEPKESWLVLELTGPRA